MCCSGGPGGIRLTRCGVVCGIAALAALSTALLGPAWLHTEEKLNLPYLPRNFANVVSVRFKLGLFRVCPRIVKPANLTVHPRSVFGVPGFFADENRMESASHIPEVCMRTTGCGSAVSSMESGEYTRAPVGNTSPGLEDPLGSVCQIGRRRSGVRGPPRERGYGKSVIEVESLNMKEDGVQGLNEGARAALLVSVYKKFGRESVIVRRMRVWID
ncbi:hypothetical protein WN48_03291 [Eufriesea mexicana]|uniref:Uncharacterized protein n=1 Tax=Eufriesea mexicana TaxID=516756 RepID=A0A310SJR0_9HYME|nr:hypothetical protein WN48_03291 [Eufriesea mexicana]